MSVIEAFLESSPPSFQVHSINNEGDMNNVGWVEMLKGRSLLLSLSRSSSLPLSLSTCGSGAFLWKSSVVLRLKAEGSGVREVLKCV